MNSVSELFGWVDKIAAASRALDAANHALNEDKAQRQSSLKGRFVDWLTTTPAERAVEEGREAITHLTTEGREAARKWVIRAAKAALMASSDFTSYEQQQQRHKNAMKRVEKIGHLLNLAENADRKLRDAESACESASDTEFLDLVSDNKGISILSHMETETAKDEIDDATAAIRSLAAAMPKRAKSAKIDRPDDFLDLVVDLTIDPIFDVMSWFNMEKLDNAANQCRKARQNISPLLAKLNSINGIARERLRTEDQVLLNIEAAYIHAAMAQVPHEISISAPKSLRDTA